MIFARQAAATPPPDDFAEKFTGRTLRFDYFHCGSSPKGADGASHLEEHVAIDSFRLENEWAGSRTQRLDTLGLGQYRFTVLDARTKEPLYSRGFSSLFFEWKTTAEAQTCWRSFHESQRFPEPRAPVVLVLESRADDLSWKELWRGECDPNSRFVDRSTIASHGAVMPIFESGPVATKVDLLIVGDGYTGKQRDDFLDDVHRLVGALFVTEPFKSRHDDFNVRAILAPSPLPGITDPRRGVFVDTAVRLQFNAFDVDRYMLTTANRELREIAAQGPYDTLILLANTRKYGGGGLYNLWSTCAADTEPANYVFVHEFGHNFGGLGDEYYTSQVAYLEFTKHGTEPWEPNVTALLDPARLKWRDLVAADTPIPSPWDQAAYDAMDLGFQLRRQELVAKRADDTEFETLMRETKVASTKQLAAEPLHGKVGAFQGASYEAKGLYRPCVDCIMFTRNPTSFCPVCERALSRAIDQYTK
jgi:hypothetical protein